MVLEICALVVKSIYKLKRYPALNDHLDLLVNTEAGF